MTPTSNERREVAERLRQMADAHDATEASRVARALGLEYKVYGTVVAFDSVDVHRLAELIDPTCKVEDDNPWASDYDYVCRACGEHFSTCDKPNYCPGCGCRCTYEEVVDE